MCYMFFLTNSCNQHNISFKSGEEIRRIDVPLSPDFPEFSFVPGAIALKWLQLGLRPLISIHEAQVKAVQPLC